MQLYDITITASQTRQLDAAGNYFYYYAGSAGGADPTITLRGLSSGLRIVLKPGQAFRLPAGSNENSWVMTNYAGAATIIGSVIVGNGEITDNRVTGSVEIVDGGKNRSASGGAFMANIYAGTLAGNYSVAQLWNPAASTKNVFVNAFGICSATTGAMIMKSYNTAAATLQATGYSKDLKNAQTSVIETRVTNLPTGVGSNLASFQNTANQPILVTLQEPIMLRPGSGLIVQAGQFATDITFNAEYFEETI
jgi:hypothetical protein